VRLSNNLFVEGLVLGFLLEQGDVVSEAVAFLVDALESSLADNQILEGPDDSFLKILLHALLFVYILAEAARDGVPADVLEVVLELVHQLVLLLLARDHILQQLLLLQHHLIFSVHLALFECLEGVVEDGVALRQQSLGRALHGVGMEQLHLILELP